MGVALPERVELSLPLYVERAALHRPALSELAKKLNGPLTEHFSSVEVYVGPCVDLRSWGLSFDGLCGHAQLLDVGGVLNLVHPSGHHRSFALPQLLQCAGFGARGCVLGAASGDAEFVGRNSELMLCETVTTDAVGAQEWGKKRTSRMATVLTAADSGDGPHAQGEGKRRDGACQLDRYPHSRVGYLANLYASEGSAGDVLCVRVARRTGETADFVEVLREALQKTYPGRAVGLGGVFRVDGGRFKAHVMPDFKQTEMKDAEEVNEWLQFFEFGAGAVMLTTMLSEDPTGGLLNLRLSHTHFYNDAAGEGGHYHNDTSPEDVAYTAYLHPAEYIYRIENCFDREHRCLQP